MIDRTKSLEKNEEKDCTMLLFINVNEQII